MNINLSGYSDSYNRIGYSLLERDRGVDRLPTQLLNGIGNPFSPFEPDEGDFKGLKKALEFFKFTPEEVSSLRNVIGTAVNIGTSITSITGTVGTVVDLAKKLGIFGDQEKSIESYLKDIMKRVDQIYAFLENEAKRGLQANASSWRATVDNTRVIVANVRISRDDNVLDRAESTADRMSEAIRLMLDPAKATISFRRSAYGSQSPHWSDLAGSPLMTRADGASISLNSDGSAEIWDAGHYLDVLVYALRERLIMANLLEPAFQSTAYDRSNLGDIGDKINMFVAAWRSSILVMNPDAQLLSTGFVYNPRHPYPSEPPELKSNILLGAVDPVTGISSVNAFGGFEKSISFSGTPVGTHSYVWASDVEAARQAATYEQAKRLDQVVQACGILDLERLGRAFHDAARVPTRSQFVSLSSPQVTSNGPIDIDTKFGVISSPVVLENGQPEEVTLGDLAAFSGNPNKSYKARRFFRSSGKSTKFRVALRADRTKIQLGYRLVVCGTEIPVVPFSFRAAGTNDFPLKTIDLAHEFDTTVWDICQSKHLTLTEESRLESEPDAFVQVKNNRRPGRANVQIRITYTPPAANSVSSYVGHMNVEISPLEPEDLRDAFDAKLEIFETIIGEDEKATEFLADNISTTIVPSYLVVEREFFEDRWKAFEAMLRSVKDLVIESAKLPPLAPPVPEEPDWQTRFDITVQRSLAWLRSAEEIEPLLVRNKIRQLQIPVVHRVAQYRNP
jgi:hypothetical protein